MPELVGSSWRRLCNRDASRSRMSQAVALVVADTSSHDAPSVKTVDLPRPGIPVELVRTGPQGRRLWVIGLPVSLDGSVEHLLHEAVTHDLARARRALTAFDGAFAAFLWDPAERRLLVVNDIAGLQP